MKNKDLNSSRQSFNEAEIFIKEMISTYLTDRGINENRLYFADFIVVKVDDTSYYVNKTNNIEEIYDLLSNNDKKIIFNISTQFAEYYSLYANSDNKDDIPKFDWKTNITWGFIDKENEAKLNQNITGSTFFKTAVEAFSKYFENVELPKVEPMKKDKKK